MTTLQEHYISLFEHFTAQGGSRELFLRLYPEAWQTVEETYPEKPFNPAEAMYTALVQHGSMTEADFQRIFPEHYAVLLREIQPATLQNTPATPNTAPRTAERLRKARADFKALQEADAPQAEQEAALTAWEAELDAWR